MLNKKLVLGSFVGATLMAGAMILAPVAAQAGVVAGVCTGCHTMHDSVEGVDQGTPGQNNQLLLFDGCVGCHTGAENDATGLGTGGMAAPQVSAQADTNTINAGGYFLAGAGTNMHSTTSIAGITANLDTAPGGTFLTTGLTCEACHTAASGGHHATVSTYRFMTGVTAVADANYGVGETSVSAYDNTSINSMCASCHPNFHGTANTGATTGNFTRHPTNVIATGIVNSAAIPTGIANEVMCILCHRPYGSAETDLLRFSYAANVADDTNTSLGCETCHGAK